MVAVVVVVVVVVAVVVVAYCSSCRIRVDSAVEALVYCHKSWTIRALAVADFALDRELVAAVVVVGFRCFAR